MSEIQKTLAVDFDGTICDHEFPNIGQIKPGVSSCIKFLRSVGFRIIIWSCRTSKWNDDIFGDGVYHESTLDRARVKEMIKFLEENDIPYDEIDDGTKGKPTADHYVDDKGLKFTNWVEVVQIITGWRQADVS